MFCDHGGLSSFAEKYKIDIDWLAGGKGSLATAFAPQSLRATFKVVH
jgi:hypothetical protein